MWTAIASKGAVLRNGLVLSFALTVGTVALPTTAAAQVGIVVDQRCLGNTCCVWVTIQALFYVEEFFLGCTTSVAAATIAPARSSQFAARIPRSTGPRRSTGQAAEVARASSSGSGHPRVVRESEPRRDEWRALALSSA